LNLILIIIKYARANIIEQAEVKFSPSGIYQEDTSYSQKGEAIKNATNANIITMELTHRPFATKYSENHVYINTATMELTHRPFATKYSENHVYINTAEWIYNIKHNNRRCKLEKKTETAKTTTSKWSHGQKNIHGK
jgi:hypothetical protein